MTREEKIDMFMMRLDGASFQDCANKYGLSKQRVRQIILDPYGNSAGKRVDPRKYKRHTLAEVIIKKYGTLKNFEERSGIYPTTVQKLLNGGTVSSKTVDAVLKFTGLTYEEAFR